MTYEEAGEALAGLFDERGDDWALSACWNGTYDLIAECWEYPELQLEVLHRIAKWDKKRRKLFLQCISRKDVCEEEIEERYTDENDTSASIEAERQRLTDKLSSEIRSLQVSHDVDESDHHSVSDPGAFTVMVFYNTALDRVQENGVCLPNGEAYRLYKAWCDTVSYKPVSATYFRKVMSRWVEPRKESGKMVYPWVIVKPEWDGALNEHRN
jgi:hypothetical protein